MYRIHYIALHPQTLVTLTHLTELLYFPCEVKSLATSTSSFIIYMRQHPKKVMYRLMYPSQLLSYLSMLLSFYILLQAGMKQTNKVFVFSTLSVCHCNCHFNERGKKLQLLHYIMPTWETSKVWRAYQTLMDKLGVLFSSDVSNETELLTVITLTNPTPCHSPLTLQHHCWYITALSLKLF